MGLVGPISRRATSHIGFLGLRGLQPTIGLVETAHVVAPVEHGLLDERVVPKLMELDRLPGWVACRGLLLEPTKVDFDREIIAAAPIANRVQWLSQISHEMHSKTQCIALGIVAFRATEVRLE